MKNRLNFFLFSVPILILASLVFSITTVALAAELSVERAAICQDVVEREPVDEGTSFPVSVGKLYCFTKIVGAETPAEVIHVWYFGDVERGRITLSIGGSSWRTYSSKVIQEHEIGSWRVEVLDASGKVLQTINFTVTQ